LEDETAVVILFAEPYQNRMSLAVDLAHQLDLMIPFVIIALVNAKSIAPKIVMVGMRSQLCQKIPEIQSDFHQPRLVKDMEKLEGGLRTPFVR
jgi:hypothetical protein